MNFVTNPTLDQEDVHINGGFDSQSISTSHGDQNDSIHNKEDPPKYFLITLVGAKELILKGPINILLVSLPISILCWIFSGPQYVTFIFGILALAPLAERLGFVTEQLALYTNPTIGGLLNATFGNATELIISIAALINGYYRLIQLSLLGSILSNLLLVMGMSFFFGGLKYPTQKFGKLAGQLNSSMLMMSTMSLMFPAVLDLANQDNPTSELDFSRFVSLILLVMYGANIYFQLNNAHVVESLTSGEQTVEEEEEEEKIIGMNESIFWLVVITFAISILSSAVVATIENATNQAKISKVFVSTIVLPIVGNAAEHASAIMFARKNKLDVSIGIAIGSSTQIALFVIPLLVLLGWATNRPMSLYFHAYSTCTILLATILITFAIQGGRSNWLVGLLLIGAYLIVSAGFWVHIDEQL